MFSNSTGGSSNNSPGLSNHLRHFAVYTDLNEELGTVVDVLTDETGRSRFLIIDLSFYTGGKQIALPLNYVLIDERSQRVIVLGLTRAQVAELPAYNSGRSESTGYREAQPAQRQQHSTSPVVAPLENSLPLEASAPLDYQVEASAPVNYQETIHHTVQPGVLAGIPPLDTTTLQENQTNPTFTESPIHYQEPLPPQPLKPVSAADTVKEPVLPPRTVQEEPVRLLEERLVVDRKKRKVGEVIVRKEVETRMVEVPVRREKLIVEQVSPERKQLASVALGQPEIDGVEFTQVSDSESQRVVSGEFASAKAASQFLDAIASQPNPGYQKIQVKVIVENADLQKAYQQWLDHYSATNRIQFES